MSRKEIFPLSRNPSQSLTDNGPKNMAEPAAATWRKLLGPNAEIAYKVIQYMIYKTIVAYHRLAFQECRGVLKMPTSSSESDSFACRPATDCTLIW
jgi:hypothetical protein